MFLEKHSATLSQLKAGLTVLKVTTKLNVSVGATCTMLHQYAEINSFTELHVSVDPKKRYLGVKTS